MTPPPFAQRIAALFLLNLLVISGSAAQVVEGEVVDAETGATLPGVSVLIRGTTQGAATDEAGRYRLEVQRPGTYVLVAQALGYVEAAQRVEVREGRTSEVSFRLTPDVIELDQVEVVAGRRQEASDPQPSLMRIEPEEAERLPGAAEDVLRALQSVPGVLAASDFTSQLIVRGGGPDQNLIILDDVEVFNPYRLYGVVSMFNPVVVADIRLLTGGFPARYGDRLSSVLDVETRTGSATRRLGGSLNASVVNTNLVLEGRTGFMNGAWLATGRRTYYDLLLGVLARRTGTVEGGVSFPNFADLQGKVVLRPAARHKLLFGTVFSRDALEVDVEGADFEGSDADRFAADDLTRNDIAYGAWHWNPSDRLFSKWTLSWYRNGGTFGSDGQFVPRDAFNDSRIVASSDTASVFEFGYDQRFLFRKWSLSQQTAWRGGRHFVEAGAGVDLLRTTLRYNLELNEVARAYFEAVQQNNPEGPGAFPEQFDQSKGYYRYHAYVQDRVALWNRRLFFQPGLRFDYYRIVDEAYLSPRLNASLALTAQTTLRAAWGRYRQSPGFEKLIDEGQVFDLSDGAGIETLAAERATHRVLGLTQRLSERYEFRLEGYLKTFDGLIVQRRSELTRYRAQYVISTGLSPTNPRAYELRRETTTGLTASPTNEAEGRAYGIEAVLEKRYLGAGDRLSGWASYAYAHAYRTRAGLDDAATDVRTPFDYDRRHVANLALDYRLGRAWRLGATFRYGTGFPYTPATGYAPVVVTRFDADDPTSEPEVEILTDSRTGLARFDVVYAGEEGANSARLPVYHRLDVRLSRALRFFGLDGQVYVDVVNVYNRKNLLAYRYAVTVDPSEPERSPRLRRERTNMLPILPTVGLSFTF